MNTTNDGDDTSTKSLNNGNGYEDTAYVRMPKIKIVRTIEREDVGKFHLVEFGTKRNMKGEDDA